jgi:LuxR family transcriptional regulator, maltose regulon positive regulatory protein
VSLPILKTKLVIPPSRPELVLRPRLIEKLNPGLSHKLTILSAPAGFGKTTLLSSWAAQIDSTQVSWFSLDHEDNSFPRFLTYLVTALQSIESHFGAGALSAIQSPGAQQLDFIITNIINEISDSDMEWVLVLDDYHLIESESIHQALTLFINHLPKNFHLVISTRIDPPLPLSHLRGQGQLTELRFKDLQFTFAEASEFLNKVMGLNLIPEEIQMLEQRTEGWIAGLQMAAISMQSFQEKSDFIDVFSGSHHFILDYLVEEVLERQPHNVQDFLLKTSILERMTADLCNVVIGTNDANSILLQLEQANLFLVPLDEERCWFRFHHLFADLLINILKQRQSPKQLKALHRRASKWHQNNGTLEEAIFHAIAGEDFERAAVMIEENIAGMFMRSEVPILLGWIEKLPKEIIYSRPWIDVYRANTLALASQLDEVDPLLDGVERRIEPETQKNAALLGHIAAIRAYTANLRGDGAYIIEMAQRTKHYLPSADVIARGMAAYALADFYFTNDDMDRASQELQDMLRVGQHTGQIMMSIPALCYLAAIRKVQGKLNQAEKLYGRVRRLMAENQGRDSRVRYSYEFGLADLLRERNQLDEAHEHAIMGIELRQRLGGYLVTGDIVLMRILQAMGDVNGAMDVLHITEKFKQTYPFQMGTTLDYKTARVVQCLALGDVETANHWAEACIGGTELEQLVLARLYLAQDKAADAQRLLNPQRIHAETGGRTGRLIEILGLLAIAQNMQGQTDEAVALLSHALSLARPEGYMRVFLDMGSPLYCLLEQIIPQDISAGSTFIKGEYVRGLLDEFQRQNQAAATASKSSPFPKTHLDNLTDREEDVLRLLAEGLTNKQIANQLVVAPSTIKQHLKNIFRKLDVHSRTQAVARGRELNLL